MSGGGLLGGGGRWLVGDSGKLVSSASFGRGWRRRRKREEKSGRVMSTTLRVCGWLRSSLTCLAMRILQYPTAFGGSCTFYLGSSTGLSAWNLFSLGCPFSLELAHPHVISCVLQLEWVRGKTAVANRNKCGIGANAVRTRCPRCDSTWSQVAG